MKTMVRNLIIGYGNLERQDDGVAFHVVNRLRRHLAQKPLDCDDDGMSRLGGGTDSVFIRQLVPELIETIVHYDRVIFVDAHVPADRPKLVCTRLNAGDGMALFSHHMHPAMLLGILKAVWDREPLSHLFSIQGFRFDLGRRLSAKTAGLVGPAAAMILDMLDTLPDPACRRPGENQRIPTSVE
jgi:hydrogenase maturation protease